jgi:hypothetical protein
MGEKDWMIYHFNFLGSWSTAYRTGTDNSIQLLCVITLRLVGDLDWFVFVLYFDSSCILVCSDYCTFVQSNNFSCNHKTQTISTKFSGNKWYIQNFVFLLLKFNKTVDPNHELPKLVAAISKVLWHCQKPSVELYEHCGCPYELLYSRAFRLQNILPRFRLTPCL